MKDRSLPDLSSQPDPSTPSVADLSAPKYTAPALEKGLDILELLSRSDAGLSQTEIARDLGRSVGEIFRMLVVLSERGYVAQDPVSDRYALTTLLFEVAHRTPLIRRLTSTALPLMRDLAHAINQSVHLAVLADDAVLIVGQMDPPARHVMSIRLGTRVDLWRASSGRVMLAFQPPEELARAFARVPLPPGMTEERVRTDLVRIRQAGHEIVDSFVVRGIVNISTPIIDHTGLAIAALTVPHLQRYGEPISFADCCERAIETATRLSRSLGGGVAV